MSLRQKLWSRRLVALGLVVLFIVGGYAIAERISKRKAAVQQRTYSDQFTQSIEQAQAVAPDGVSGSGASVSVCSGEFQNPPAGYSASWFVGDEYYAVLQDPSALGCVSTYPFNVENVIWTVFNQDPGSLGFEVQPMVWQAVDDGTGCMVPGALLCSGPTYSISLPSTGAFVLTIPLDDFCCVDDPYFVGVYVPTILGTGHLGLYLDDGTFDGTEPLCTNYNDYTGTWEDLVAVYSFPGNLSLYSEGLNSTDAASDCQPITCNPSTAWDVLPGSDMWTTPPGGSTFDSTFAHGTPVPADFFGPGSDPFTGGLVLEGSPLSSTPSGVLGSGDAIVERLEPACFEQPCNDTAQVPIQIVALSLVSSQPITVTYGGGSSPEIWDVRVCLSSTMPQPTGVMVITHDCEEGGSWVSDLQVIPQFIFTRLSDNAVRVLDVGIGFSFGSSFSRWTHTDPGFGLIKVPPGVTVDHDCDPLSPEISVAPGSNFCPGIWPIPCDCTTPSDYLKRMTFEESLWAQHGIYPTQEEGPDSDGDGVPDDADNCSADSNPLQEDADHDGVGDVCDNCPDTPNTDQLDSDGDHIGDACETSGICCTLAGDVSNDGAYNISDGVYIVNHIFKGGPAPVCCQTADTNGDNSYNISDGVRIIDHIFKGGPAPICNITGWPSGPCP